MGPLPKRRHSTHRSGRRQSQIKQNKVHLIKCPNCGAMKRSHRICPECHTYATPKAEKKAK